MEKKQKLRVLGLHGFRTSADILKKQVGKWDSRILERLDIHFLDGPFPAGGKSDVENHFPPPYYEWFQFDYAKKEVYNIDQCVSYIENYVAEYGPFHGFLGFSQGAILSAALLGLQRKGLALSKVSQLNFVIVVSGAILMESAYLRDAYSTPIDCPSLHFLGEQDFLRPRGEELLKCFVEPVVIRHPVGHTVPRLDEEGVQTLVSFLDRVEDSVTLKGGLTWHSSQKSENGRIQETENTENKKASMEGPKCENDEEGVQTLVSFMDRVEDSVTLKGGLAWHSSQKSENGRIQETENTESKKASMEGPKCENGKKDGADQECSKN